MRLLPFFALVTCAVVVGCGGGGGGGSVASGNTTATGATGSTGSDTSGTDGTTGPTNVDFTGNYQGSFTGLPSNGSRYSGTGTAQIASDGTVTLRYSATSLQAPQSDVYTGTVTTTGAFTGQGQAGDTVSGTFSKPTDTTLRVILTRTHLNADGSTAYTANEQFSLNQSPTENP